MINLDKTPETIGKLRKILTSVVVIAAEIAVVVFVGATIGSHLNSVTILADCSRVSIAKVGDTFVNCTVIEPKKDPATAAPR